VNRAWFFVVAARNRRTVSDSRRQTYSFTWTPLLTNCWDSTATETKLSGTALTQIGEFAWQVGTNASQTMPFDFCVSNVKINP
jgi:hypothetical protein